MIPSSKLQWVNRPALEAGVLVEVFGPFTTINGDPTTLDLRIKILYEPNDDDDANSFRFIPTNYVELLGQVRWR